MSSNPLDFRFVIDAAHRGAAVARLRVPARYRHALIRAGIETLDELNGMTGRDLAESSRLKPIEIAEMVRALRWRCVESFPSWPLLRTARVVRLQLPGFVRIGLVWRAVGDVGELFELGPAQLAAAVRAEEAAFVSLFDRLARVAQLPESRLTAVSRCRHPWRLPVIHPEILIAFAMAECLEEQIVALSLGNTETESAILLARWIHASLAPPSFETIARRFGTTGERVRQIATDREELLRNSGLELPPFLVEQLGFASDQRILDLRR